MFSLIGMLRAPFGAMFMTRIALRCLPRYPACLSALKGLLHRVILDWIVACPVWGDVHYPNRIALFATLSGLPIGPEGPPTQGNS